MQTPPALEFLIESDGFTRAAREHAERARGSVQRARRAIAESRAALARLEYKGHAPSWRRVEHARFLEALLGA